MTSVHAPPALAGELVAAGLDPTMVLWASGRSVAAALEAAAGREDVSALIAVAPQLPWWPFARRPLGHAAQVGCPVLFQIADFDKAAGRAAITAVRARAIVHRYPCGQQGLRAGGDWHDRVLADQLRFLARVLTPANAGASG